MIAAIIILFHPDQREIGRLLSSLAGQVDTVFAIDNTPGSAFSDPPFLEGFGKPVSYVPLGENRGIAAAQNVGIALSMQCGYSHVLLFDQDSVLLPGAARTMLDAEQSLLNSGVRVGAICPQVDDRRSGRRPAAVHYRWFAVHEVRLAAADRKLISTDNLIASGSLIRIDTLESVGLMREDLFIEYVDTEWAFRAGSMGYSNYCAGDAFISHSLGDESTRMFGKDFYLYSSLRYQYKLRNAVFLLRLRTMGWHWRIYTAARIPYHLVLYSLLSKKQCNTFFSLLGAIGNGMRGKLGPIIEPSARCGRGDS